MKHHILAVAALAAAAVGCQHQAPSGSLEARVAKLEAAYARNAEALEFLAKVYAQQKAQQQAQQADEPADDAVFAVDIAEDVKLGQVEGPASAPVTIIKAFDFACPYCYRSTDTLKELTAAYGDKIRIVYMNLIVHPVARPAHLASCAAAKQGKYKAFKDAFWAKAYVPYEQSKGQDAAKLGEDNIFAIAKEIGLNVGQLKTDMAGSACAARIEGDMAELVKFHVDATPTFFINGKEISGALPVDEFKKLIDDQLKVVAASGVPAAKYYDDVVLAKGEKQFRAKSDPK
ncbi:MAG TPA: thioredoxin domain-containing protein [Kofleriaceae bacterium]|nr:thioredoxin domain-containing protein [Kofleriaceae bacterium]